MTSTLDVYLVEYPEFCRARGYHDFKLDIDTCDSELDIAARALHELCDGSCDTMDTAVVHAVLEFLESRLHASTIPIEDMGRTIFRLLPISLERAERLLNTWYGD